MRKIILTAAVFLIFLLTTKPAFAASLQFSGTPSTFNYNDSFTINVNFEINSASGSAYYIAGAFTSLDVINYFGFTKNDHGIWHNGSSSTFTDYYEIKIDQDGKWNGQIEVKLDTSDSGFKGGGTYNFKLARYTAGGSKKFCDTETSPCSVATINVIAPTPTPTPTTKPQHTLSPTKNSVQTEYSNLPPISPNYHITSISAPDNMKETISIDPSKVPSPVLGASKSAAEKATKSAEEKNNVLVEGASKNNFRYIALGTGTLALACAIIFYIKIKHKQMN